MTKGEILGYMMKLQSEVDVEGIMLMGMFLKRAVESGDPKEFVKGVLKAVVEVPESQARTQVVEVKVLPKKAGGR